MQEDTLQASRLPLNEVPVAKQVIFTIKRIVAPLVKPAVVKRGQRLGGRIAAAKSTLAQQVEVAKAAVDANRKQFLPNGPKRVFPPITIHVGGTVQPAQKQIPRRVLALAGGPRPAPKRKPSSSVAGFHN
jgi:hypothetical protein